jgi:phosphate ABC transporter phosphate-binding protein
VKIQVKMREPDSQCRRAFQNEKDEALETQLGDTLMIRQLLAGLCAVTLLAAAGCGRNGETKDDAKTAKNAKSASTPDGAKPRLNAAGATFIYPMMKKWTGVYDKEKGVQINYMSIGSGGGIQKFTTKEVDFGCSDAPLNDEQMGKAKKSGGDLVHIPLAMGAVVPAYNLEAVKEPVHFTGPVLADIFMRKITKWNDERIKAINPKIASQLPDLGIVVVHRSDGSGTTFVFADYLAKVSPEWKKEVGVSTSLKWAKDTTGAKGSEGVTGQVKLNPGAICYVELNYATQNKIAYGAVQNQEKEFVLASLEAVTAAADNSIKSIPDDLRYSITNAPGKESYPISGTTFAFLWVNQSGAKGREVVDFARWVTREEGGQKYCKEMDYAPLPKSLIGRIDTMLEKVKISE